jgi:F-type H+-transporting ATPase subunit gamma
MPSTRDIRRRIKSVKNTAQITKAMKMVAASQDAPGAAGRARAAAPYADADERRCSAALRTAGAAATSPHPLLEQREVDKRARHRWSARTRACAARFNTNLLARGRPSSTERRPRCTIGCIGRKGAQFVAPH